MPKFWSSASAYVEK